MKNVLHLFFFCCLIPELCFAQGILTLVDSTQLPQASIWGVISYNGINLSVTTTTEVSSHAHLFLRKVDVGLNQVGSIAQITSDADPQTSKGLTDHKQIFLNSNHYVTFSVRGDSDIYIFKMDSAGTRVGSITTVIQGTADRTNDMIFVTDSTYLWVGYYHPPFQTTFHKFDQSLSAIGSPVITSATLPHNNTGNAILHNGKFYMFTGSTFGYTSNLILTKWNTDWTPVAGSSQTLIPSASGDGNWFSTGVAYDSTNRRWYIGFSHIYSTDPLEGEHMDIAAFDDNFVLLERRHETPSHYYRPHFILQNGYLYMAYDAGSSGVFLHKYHVAVSQEQLQLDVSNLWNIVSVPLIVDDYRKDTLFPTAISPAYSYQGGYNEEDTLGNGKGYWLKFSSAQQISMAGTSLNDDTVDVVEGWNLIGSISVPIAVIGIASIPPAIVTSNFFGYNGGYFVIDTLDPGKGGWVKSSQDGLLILSSSAIASRADRINIVPTSDLPPVPPARRSSKNSRR